MTDQPLAYRAALEAAALALADVDALIASHPSYASDAPLWERQMDRVLGVLSRLSVDQGDQWTPHYQVLEAFTAEHGLPALLGVLARAVE